MMDENMIRMQQEAVERVRQMQERARKYVEKDEEVQPKVAGDNSVNPFREPVQALNPESKAIEAASGGKNISPFKKGLSFLDGFGEDGEQLLLLMLAVLLVRNEAPIELVLAILYIAM
ncbi:MAG TPA: hypothetical protein DEB10_14145 [Ruminococcaceae bacterium]|jgi:replication initiation and membrane attachment protein DnaB|nr:hypothetical protein [Oscillospiraceae bacterium]